MTTLTVAQQANRDYVLKIADDLVEQIAALAAVALGELAVPEVLPARIADHDFAEYAGTIQAIADGCRRAQNYADTHLRDRIRCPRCRKVSYNPHDIAERYCGHCHRFHGREPAR